ncbi:MAG: hypothetical protein CME57_03160 [Halieaceae bacterium]|nr:hypothetical protein [Halieaceae bacterium]
MMFATGETREEDKLLTLPSQLSQTDGPHNKRDCATEQKKSLGASSSGGHCALINHRTLKSALVSEFR